MKRKPSEAINAFLKSGRGINVAELAEELISAFGGSREFARTYHTEFKEGTKPGGIARSKMLDGVLRIITAAGAQNKGQKGDVSVLSDEELSEELCRLLRKQGLEIPDAQEEKAADSQPG